MNRTPIHVHKYAVGAIQNAMRISRSDDSHLDSAATLARVEECTLKTGEEAAAGETLNVPHHPPIQLPYKLRLRPA
jgi:hypothetical protein